LLLVLILLLEVFSAGLAVQTRFAVEERVLLDGTAGVDTLVLAILRVSVVAVGRGCDVRDLFGDRVLAADGGDTDV
jgi:hypothetical protein